MAKRSDTEMVRPCGEKDWRRCSNDNMEDGSGWTSKYVGTPKRRWGDAPTPNRENVEQEVSYTFADPTWMCFFVIVVAYFF